MTYASICAGIEGFGKGFEDAGMTCVWRCEKDKACQSVLKHHWPNEPLYDDMRTLPLDELEHPDVLCAGTPCQAFSVAGKRESLQDARGNLTLAFAMIADRFPNALIVWENVPGVLSADDNAFGCFIAALVGNSDPVLPFRDDGKWPRAGVVSGPRRTVGWRILNAEYFGVPQRRRRVFLVGHSRIECVTQILFEPENMRRNSPPSRETGTRIAASLTQGSGVSSNAPGRRREDDINLVCSPALRAQAQCSHRADSEAFVVAHALRAEGFDASEDGTGRGTPIVPVAFGWQFSEHRSMEVAPHCPPLEAQTIPAVATDLCVRRLTPTEAERLQGFPDGWTKHSTKGIQADGPRYRQLGNAVNRNVGEWLGKRIVAALDGAA